MAIKALADNAQWISAVETQGELETDWAQEEVVVEYTPKEIKVENTSTNLLLESFDVLTQGDEVRLYNGTDSVVSGELGTTTTTAGLVDIHDIFGDGSCIATYNLDGNANNLGGSHNGVPNNVTYGTGKFGQTAVFNGVSSLIGLPQDFTGQPDYSWSVSGWIKFNTIKECTLINFGGLANGIAMGILSDGTILMGMMNNGINHRIESGITAITGVWYHLTMSYNAKTVYFYVDGSFVGDNSNGYTNGTNPDALGGSVQSPLTGSNGSFHLNGSIDQVRIFNRALTPQEVRTLYNEQATKYTADISSFALTNAPTKAYFDKTPLVRLSIDDNMSTLTPLTIDASSSTNQLVVSETILNGDRYIVDGVEFTVDGNVTNNGSLWTIAETFGSVPKKAFKIDSTIDTSSVCTKASETFDGTKFTWTANQLSKAGRNMKYQLIGDTGTTVSKVIVHLTKEG